jgi:hypothetical protein
MDEVERVARAICDADPLAPESDAPIYLGMKEARAWQARIPMARAAIAALRAPDLPVVRFPTGCKRKLAEGQWWVVCGETDMGQTAPALCAECGGDLKLADAG